MGNLFFQMAGGMRLADLDDDAAEGALTLSIHRCASRRFPSYSGVFMSQ